MLTTGVCMKDTQNVWPAGSQVGSSTEDRGTSTFCDGNRGEVSAGMGERRLTRFRGRLVLTVAVALFVSAFLQGCSGSFFSGPTLSSMYVTPASRMIATSGTTQLAAYGMYSDGNQSKISTDKVSWSSSDPAVATVTSPGGLVTAVSIGTATITASTTETIPSSGCSVDISGGGITKTCRSASSETVTATATINVTE
jgi:hypothetical protein